MAKTGLQIPSASVAALRSITLRLSDAAPSDLPLIASQTAKLLWNCRDLLSTPSDALKSAGDVPVLVHKYKTQISTLLQDRTIEGRWAGVVLAKATLEAGGLEVLSKSGPWTRFLLGILKKPDPPTVRILAILVLTRIFMLTWDDPNLVREITTPVLSTFVSTCLVNADHKRCSSRELQIILDSFKMLISRHPNIFRTHESQIRSLAAKILSSRGQDCNLYFNIEHKASAQILFSLLHHCAAKQGGAEKWAEILTSAISAAHATCDHLFRSLIEDTQSTTNRTSPLSAQSIVAPDQAELESDSFLQLSGWRGITAGAERVVTVLGIIRWQLNTSTSSAVALRFGSIIDLLSRICNVTTSSKANNEVSRDEREQLALLLPSIHTATIKLARTIISRFGKASPSLVPSIVECTREATVAGLADSHLRAAVHGMIGQVITLQGSTMTKSDTVDIEPIIKACCEDQMRGHDKSQIGNSNLPFAQSSPVQGISEQTAVSAAFKEAASRLLCTLIAKINPAILNPRIRVQMERAAILSRNKDALVASVLNPIRSGSNAQSQASLMPILARQFSDSAEVEALIRPRMPVLQTGMRSRDDAVDDEIQDDIEIEAHSNAGDLIGQHGDDENAEQNSPSAQLLESVQEDTDLAVDQISAVMETRNGPDHTTAKRGAPEAIPELSEQTSKRVRTFPAEQQTPAQVEMDGITQALASADPVAVDVPPSSSNVTFATVPSQQTVTAIDPSTTIPSSAIARPDMTMDDSDMDGSDFEMPPLTMDPDTEDEGMEGETDDVT